jgi:hypothetical protein
MRLGEVVPGAADGAEPEPELEEKVGVELADGELLGEAAAT